MKNSLLSPNCVSRSGEKFPYHVPPAFWPDCDGTSMRSDPVPDALTVASMTGVAEVPERMPKFACLLSVPSCAVVSKSNQRMTPGADLRASKSLVAAVMVLVALVATLLLSATVSTTSYVPDSVNWCDAVAPVAELPSPKSHAYDTIWAPFDGVAIELKSNVSGAISITEMLAEGEVGAQNPTPFGP